MKRFIVIFLSVLLILPVLLVPCFAVSDHIISDFRAEYTSIVGGYVTYQSDLQLVSGWYKFRWTTNYGYFLSDPVYVSFSPYYEGFVASFNVTFRNASEDSVDLSINTLTGNGLTVFYVPVLFDAAIYSGSYITLQSVQDGVVSDLSSVGSAVLSWISGIVSVIVERPLLLFTVGIFFLGGCIALFSRFLSRD